MIQLALTDDLAQYLDLLLRDRWIEHKDSKALMIVGLIRFGAALNGVQMPEVKLDVDREGVN